MPEDQPLSPKVAFPAHSLDAQEGLQQCFDALNESNKKLSIVWKRREQLYKECCQRIKEFKDEENVIKTCGASDLQRVQPTISKLTSSGAHFEKAMREYQKFGSDLREEVDLNLRHMTTETHLLEKIRSVINPDPDIKNQKVMDTIFEYYMGLGNLYSLLVTRTELMKPQRMVRAYIIDKFYMEIEAAVIQLLERCRLASLNTDKIAEQTLMHEIKEFYQKVFFHNLHLFYTLLFRESSAIISIVEGLADLSVRYQLSYEDISNRAREINSQVSVQDPQRIQIFTQLQKELEQSLRQFNDTIFAKAGHPEQAKTGFLGGLFGGPKPPPQPAPKDGEITYTLEEEAFFQELMLRRKQWIGKTQESKERAVLRKELLDFSLSSNLLNSILYENTFREMLTKTREVSKSTDILEQLYSQLDEVLREVLTLQKKRVRAVLSLQSPGNQPEMVMQKVGELEIVKHSLKLLANKVQRCDETAADIIPNVLRSYISRLEATVAQEATGFKSLREDCERRLLNPGGSRTNMDSIKTLLEMGLARWNKELYSQTQVLKLNFFSLYDTDLEQIEVHFAKCFEGISRTGIGVMRLQESIPTPVEQLIDVFEEADYFLKKLITALKTVSISKITIFSNLKYGTNNFLTDDQGSGNEAEQLLASLKENRTSLATLLEAVTAKASSPHPASESIFPLYKMICQQAADLTDYLLVMYEALYQQWFAVNREFKRISKEKDVSFWLKNYQKFRQVDCDRKAFTQLFKPKDEFSDLNVFLEEIFGLFQEALKSGVLVVDFSGEAKQLASSLLPDADGRQKTQQVITAGLQKVADMLVQRTAEIGELDKKVKTFTHSEGYLFILGDSVRKYRLWMMEDKVSPLDLLTSFRNWLASIQELVEAWCQKRKSAEVLIRDLAGIDTAKIGKWISTRRYHELLAHLFRNVN